MIEFLTDYETKSLPPEVFKKGDQVSREETSERYFVGRGLAAYLIDGKLVDADHRPIVTETVAVEVVRPGERRADLAVRAGEVMTGQPSRATSGPGVPFVEAATGVEGAPHVVLEAEIERLKLALATSEDLFRDMNNSHVEAADELRRAAEGLKGEIADANVARDQAIKDLSELRVQHDSIVKEYKAALEDLDAREKRIADLEDQLKSASDKTESATDSADAPSQKSGKAKG